MRGACVRLRFQESTTGKLQGICNCGRDTCLLFRQTTGALQIMVAILRAVDSAIEHPNNEC